MIDLTKPLAFCADHAGFEIKEIIKEYARSKGIEVSDYGTFGTESCDYPDYAHAMANAIEDGKHRYGIAICGSGNGIGMTLNKHQGIRAALAWKEEIAQLARLHNDANVLVLPGRFVSPEEAKAMFDLFINTEFEGGRHANRIAKVPIKSC